MSRPRGSGVFDDRDVLDAIGSLEGDDRRWAVALAVGIGEAGLKSHHRRRGLTWRAFLDQIRGSAPLSGTLDGIERGDDGAMRGVMVRLDPATAEALLRLSKSEERPVPLQAQRLLREGLRRHGVLPSREPQPMRSVAPDAA
jgi:hypothetical protein